MDKTLIGKEGWLFLQNDSAKELEVHCNNLNLVSGSLDNRFKGIKDKYFLTIFPNKSYIMKKFLPDGFVPIFRPAFDNYLEYFGNHLLDGLAILAPIADKLTYYKTDTHINTFGAYLVYREFVEKINEIFSLGILPIDASFIESSVSSLSKLQNGIGDLTWSENLGSQELHSTDDFFYDSPDIEKIYMSHKISLSNQLHIFDYDLVNVTESLSDQILVWEIISKNILFQRNKGVSNKRVVIFYDSFLLSTLSLYLTMFTEVFMAKCCFNKDLINKLKPDLIFEFRVERFLF